MDILFDIVIPVGPNDIDIINIMINNTKKNIIGYRNIYLVSCNLNLSIEGCITINEDIFPFDKSIISKFIGLNDRIGWYLQQLIKLYAGTIISGILNNYLVIDADTNFLKPTGFFKNKLPLYNTSNENHQPYFKHMSKLYPKLLKTSNYSGICHHMLFQTNIINKLFTLVENYHKKLFFEVFLSVIDENNIMGSGASEYEIYFNFLHIYYKDNFIIRQLKWENTSAIHNNNNLDYISCHWYMR